MGITRSEAIKTLKEHLSHWERLLQEHICEEQEGIDTISALKLAIASLETDEAYQLEYERPEFCKDCISREQALRELKESAEHHANDSREEVLLRRDRDIIKALPSVTPQEPKIGHWISHRKHCENLGVIPSGLGAYEWCSNCDCGIDVREWYRNNHYNYCPNCGAKMVEPQESEDNNAEVN